MELMRSFHSFVSRRRIKNAKEWFATIGITTHERFLVWCKNENIEPPAKDIFTTIRPADQVQPPVTSALEPKANTAPKRISKTAVSKKASSRAKKKDTTWVPAAERSRVVKGKKPASTPPPSKATEEDDDEPAESTETPNS